jgi:hypothetical protein
MTNCCALCGRITLHPAVLIAGHPVGPKCAKKAGLMPLAQRKGGLVFPVGGRKSLPKRDSKTTDLFESEA